MGSVAEANGEPHAHQPLVTETPCSKKLVASVAAAVAEYGFCIPAAAAQQLQAAAGCSMDTLLLAFLEPASCLARPPISGYHVGAAGLAGSGNIYLGVNLEFKGTPLNQSVHAEQCLLTNLLLHDERELVTLAISAAPCGHCRQFFSELCCADSVRFVFGHHEHHQPEVYDLQQLLPARFGPQDLLQDMSTPLLLQPQTHQLRLSAAAEQQLEQRQQESGFVRAAEAALAAASKSYSPYNCCPSGVALLLEDGRVVAGGYIENAAHNPGLPPFQAAVVAAVVARLPSYSQVVEVVLVEVEGGAVQHAAVVTQVARIATGKLQLPVTQLTVHVDQADR